MSDGIFAFYASHAPSTLNTIRSYSSTFRMPFVTSGMAVNSSRHKFGYELYVRPLYARALVDIIRHYNWNEVWYIYNSNDGKQAFKGRLTQRFNLHSDSISSRNWLHSTLLQWLRDNVLGS